LTLLRQGFQQTSTIAALMMRAPEGKAMDKKQRFMKATQWLRPVTRWATRFSLNSPQWLPGVVRHAPLRLTSWILRGYHLVLR
jgi:hypothetical protein